MRAEPEYRDPDAFRAGGAGRRSWPVQGNRQAASAVCGREQMHRLQRMYFSLPRRHSGRVQPLSGYPQGHCQALRPGHSKHLRHPEKRPLALQNEVPGQGERPGLRPAHQAEGICQGGGTHQRAEPAFGHLRPHLHPSLRDRMHEGRCRRRNRYPAAEAIRIGQGNGDARSGRAGTSRGKNPRAGCQESRDHRRRPGRTYGSQ